MQFEWDEAKNLENIRKHEIDFADVPPIFESDMLVELDDRFNYGEERWFGIGFLSLGVAVVVWTERKNDVIRIISARRANRHEQKNLNSISRTNWAALELGSEDNIDYSDIPPLSDEFFERATLRIAGDRIVTEQTQSLVQLDPDVKQWFQNQEEHYETLINIVLRQYIKDHN